MKIQDEITCHWNWKFVCKNNVSKDSHDEHVERANIYQLAGKIKCVSLSLPLALTFSNKRSAFLYVSVSLEIVDTSAAVICLREDYPVLRDGVKES